MNKLALRHKARELWPDSKHNQRAWLRSVINLGEKWLLAKPMKK